MPIELRVSVVFAAVFVMVTVFDAVCDSSTLPNAAVEGETAMLGVQFLHISLFGKLPGAPDSAMYPPCQMLPMTFGIGRSRGNRSALFRAMLMVRTIPDGHPCMSPLESSFMIQPASVLLCEEPATTYPLSGVRCIDLAISLACIS